MFSKIKMGQGAPVREMLGDQNYLVIGGDRNVADCTSNGEFKTPYGLCYLGPFYQQLQKQNLDKWTNWISKYFTS